MEFCGFEVLKRGLLPHKSVLVVPHLSVGMGVRSTLPIIQENDRLCESFAEPTAVLCPDNCGITKAEKSKACCHMKSFWRRFFEQLHPTILMASSGLILGHVSYA